MDLQDALEYGYYFDRCIDLVFYDSDMNPIAYLNTPKRGLKPTITIKGTLTEGGYSVDTYISIQNMAFDVDIAYVNYIKARMYYSGLEEAYSESGVAVKMGGGHVIMYEVLYSDQEKEPPNRCVRFQCVVASKDYSVLNTRMYVSGGALHSLPSGKDANDLIEELTNKSVSKPTLKTVCTELIQIYNNGIVENNESKGKGNNLIELKNNIKITRFEIDESLEDMQVTLSSGSKDLKSFIRDLNSHAKESSDGKFSYARYKIYIERGCMRVVKPLPDNWREIALSEGFADYEKYYTQKYENETIKVYSVDGGSLKAEAKQDIIPLNFVKSATRSECVIYAEILFDDRITPGCACSIKANAVMGKRFGSKGSATRGSRILNYSGNKEPIIFRNTGKIEYLFSTYEDSYMKLQGPVISGNSTT